MFSPATVAVLGTVAGCHANVVSLEQLLQSPEGKAFSASLTLFQFLFVGLVALRFMVVVRWGEGRKGLSIRLRPLRISFGFHCVIALSFFIISYFNNFVLTMGIPLPAHTVFRSSSLLFNMLLGYMAFSRRYTLSQLVCALVIVIGLIVLSLAPQHASSSTPSTSSSSTATSEANSSASLADSSSSSSPSSPSAAVNSQWAVGIAILAAVSALTPFLSLLQEKAMSDAKAVAAAKDKDGGNNEKKSIVEKKDTAAAAAESSLPFAPMWAEMTCCAHLLSLPLFAANANDVLTSVSNLSTAVHGPIVAVNMATQYLCVSSVYQLVATVGSFTMTFTLTMRKFLSLLFSIVYFGHYQTLSPAEWVAILSIGLAGTAYPFLPKKVAAVSTAPHATAPTVNSAVAKRKDVKGE